MGAIVTQSLHRAECTRSQRERAVPPRPDGRGAAGRGCLTAPPGAARPPRKVRPDLPESPTALAGLPEASCYRGPQGAIRHPRSAICVPLRALGQAFAPGSVSRFGRSPGFDRYRPFLGDGRSSPPGSRIAQFCDLPSRRRSLATPGIGTDIPPQASDGKSVSQPKKAGITFLRSAERNRPSRMPAAIRAISPSGNPAVRSPP